MNFGWVWKGIEKFSAVGIILVNYVRSEIKWDKIYKILTEKTYRNIYFVSHTPPEMLKNATGKSHCIPKNICGRRNEKNGFLEGSAADPNPHQSGKLDLGPDQDPHHCEKQDPDLNPQQSEKVEAFEVQFGALEGPNR
jgi:hypothetical protein